MAVLPLFITTIADLQSRLRLTGTAQADSLRMMTETIEQVRVYLYDALGSARVAVILATAHSDAPTTNAELLRSKAELVESMWVRMILMRRMPMLFMDTSAQTQQVWNEDGLTRNMGAAGIEKELARLQNDISNLLDDLQGAVPSTSSIHVSTVGPLVIPPRPGASIGLVGSCC